MTAPQDYPDFSVYDAWLSRWCEEGDHTDCLSGPGTAVGALYPCECPCHAPTAG